MRKNKQTFFYASLVGTTMGTDSDNNSTEPINSYLTHIESVAVITPASGAAELQLFGANEVYDKVITLNKGENYLAVGSVLWINSSIELDVNGHLATDTNGKLKTPYNYVVTKVSDSQNFVSVAIRKVTVS